MRVMRTVFLAAIALALAAAGPAAAALPQAVAAPDFTVQVAQGGNVSSFTLSTALARGPVVLYFYPKSFSSGCTAEAHDFAAHIDAYKAMHATVVGISGDSIAQQVKFSTQECASKFLVAADPGLKIAKSYRSVILGLYADRTSYVIASDGKISYTYTSLDPDKHVANTLAALHALQDTPK
jgi:thioredoxin-dependent peroxiredoxin